MTPCRLGVRVQLHHDHQVLQRILLQNSAVDLLAEMPKRSTVHMCEHSIRQ